MDKDFVKSLANYSEQWVALTKDRTKVVASAKDIKELAAKVKICDSEDLIFTYIVNPNHFYAPQVCYG